jgi:chromosome segregation ATPase
MAWAAVFDAQQVVDTPPSSALWVTVAVSALGTLTGLYAVYRGRTADKRQQEFVNAKASRDELESAKADVRRLDGEVRELRDREWQATKDKSMAQDRLLRVEQELADERMRYRRLEARAQHLEARVKELEARGA